MEGMSDIRNEIEQRLGVFARPGAKAAFAQPSFSSSDLNALKRLAKEYDKKAKESKGKRTDSGMNAEWEAASIADHLREIATYAQSGQTHRAYAQVRMSSPDVVRILPASLVKAAQDATKASRPGAKVEMAVNRRKVVQDLEYLRDEARRVGDSSSRMDAENWLKRVRARDLKEHDWIEAELAASYISAELNARPGAKAKMAASISRGINPKKGGQWITGTWDGGTWGALVFSEPSEAYGIPEFPHISKLYMNPKGMPGFGDVVVNYDRGWDVRPSTPETKKGYQEIAKAVTAAAKKAAASGWYSRPGAKATAAKDDDKTECADCETEQDKAGLKLMEKADKAVSDKIRTLIKEGKPQDQAVAIALDMKRRGEL